jgi:K+-transporting ATPase A subunit
VASKGEEGSGSNTEHLGKKIKATEVKLAGMGTLVMPIAVLAITAVAVSLHARRVAPENHTTFCNILRGVDMLIVASGS